jgi:hypothetical protein
LIRSDSDEVEIGEEDEKLSDVIFIRNLLILNISMYDGKKK